MIVDISDHDTQKQIRQCVVDLLHKDFAVDDDDPFSKDLLLSVDHLFEITSNVPLLRQVFWNTPNDIAKHLIDQYLVGEI